MAMSWIKLANFALAKLGVANITSFGDGTKNSNAANLLYEQSVDEVLSVHDWNCAMTRAELDQDADTPIGDDWDYYWNLPIDPYCLRVIGLIDSDSPWLVESRNLLCNDEEVYIKYIGRITNPTRLPPILVDTLACHLAYKMANRITEAGSGLEVRMYSEYEAALLKARWQDAMEQPDNDEDTLWTIRS